VSNNLLNVTVKTLIKRDSGYVKMKTHIKILSNATNVFQRVVRVALEWQEMMGRVECDRREQLLITLCQYYLH